MRYDAYPTISFNPDNYQFGIANWNKKNNNNLTKWLEEGLVIKIEEWLFVSKDLLQNKSDELNILFELIDINIVQLNNLQEKVRYICQCSSNNIKKLASKYFNASIDLELFLYVCSLIFEQPIYLLEAIDEYPDSLNEEQKFPSESSFSCI